MESVTIQTDVLGESARSLRLLTPLRAYLMGSIPLRPFRQLLILHLHGHCMPNLHNTSFDRAVSGDNFIPFTAVLSSGSF